MGTYAQFIPNWSGMVAVQERAMASVLATLETEIKKRAPVDTGTLRNSYAHTLRPSGLNPTGWVGTNVFYAPFVEYGTTNSPAQPHVVPAANVLVNAGICRWSGGVE